jgi:hypothetical protein
MAIGRESGIIPIGSGLSGRVWLAKGLRRLEFNYFVKKRPDDNFGQHLVFVREE